MKIWRLKWKEDEVKGSTEEQIRDLRDQVKTSRRYSLITSAIFLAASITQWVRNAQALSHYQKLVEANQRLFQGLGQHTFELQKLLSELGRLRSAYEQLLSELGRLLPAYERILSELQRLL